MLRPADDLFLDLACKRGFITPEQQRWVRRRIARADLKARHICVEQGWMSRGRALTIRQDVITLLARRPPSENTLHRQLQRTEPLPRTIPWIPFALLPPILLALLTIPQQNPNSHPSKITKMTKTPTRPAPRTIDLPPAPKPRPLSRKNSPSRISIPLLTPPPTPPSLLLAAAGIPAETTPIPTIQLQATRAETEQAWEPAAIFLARWLKQRPQDIEKHQLQQRLQHARQQITIEQQSSQQQRQQQAQKDWQKFQRQLASAPLPKLPLLTTTAARLADQLPQPDALLAALHRDALQELKTWPTAAADAARDLSPHAATISLPGDLRGRLQGLDAHNHLRISLDAGTIAIAPQDLPLPQILSLLEQQPRLQALILLYTRNPNKAWPLLESIRPHPLATRLLDHKQHLTTLLGKDNRAHDKLQQTPPTPNPGDAIANRLPELIRDASFAQTLDDTTIAALYDFTTGLKSLAAKDWLIAGTPPRPDAVSAALHLEGTGQAAHKLLLGPRGHLDLHLTVPLTPPPPNARFSLILKDPQRPEAWIAPFAQQLLHQRQQKIRARAGTEQPRELLQPGRSLRLTIGRDQRRIYTAIDGQLSAEIPLKNPSRPLRIGFAWSNISLDLHAASLQLQPDPQNIAARLQEP